MSHFPCSTTSTVQGSEEINGLTSSLAATVHILARLSPERVLNERRGKVHALREETVTLAASDNELVPAIYSERQPISRIHRKIF